MEKSAIVLPEMKFIGIAVRTNNADEVSNVSAKIGPTVSRYWEEKLSEKIPNKKNPGTTYCIYADYDTDHNGNYTFLIGEEVTSFDSVETGFKTIAIPPQAYDRFNCGPGKMPDTCINAWKKIWSMQSEDLSGSRTYIADFEVYDNRSKDPKNTTFDISFDICIGVRNYDLSVDGIELKSLLKALTRLEQFMLSSHNTPKEKAGIVQAFEYCFEISWKMMKRILEQRGASVSFNSPRTTFRNAALDGLISDPELWFFFLEKRNIASHTYNQEESDQVISACPALADAMREFLKNVLGPKYWG